MRAISTGSVDQLRAIGDFPFGPYGASSSTSTPSTAAFLSSVSGAGFTVSGVIGLTMNSVPISSSLSPTYDIELLVRTKILASNDSTVVSVPSVTSLLLLANQDINQTGGTTTYITSYHHNLLLPYPLDTSHLDQLINTISRKIGSPPQSAGSFLIVPSPRLTIQSVTLSFESGTGGVAPGLIGHVQTFQAFKWLSTPYGAWGKVLDVTTGTGIGPGTDKTVVVNQTAPSWFIRLFVEATDPNQTAVSGVLTVHYTLEWP
jgi:hypothetical protein